MKRAHQMATSGLRRALALGRRVCLMLMLVCASAGEVSANTVDPAVLRDFVEGQMRRSRLPSVAVVIARPDGDVQAAAYDLRGEATTPQAPFLLGSVSKTFTGLALGQLVDAGAVRFDDPVSQHLPAFALAQSRGTITLRHLLTHTSGLSQWSGHDGRAQTLARFDHIAPVRAPGVAVEYSSLNYIVLGQVIEAVSGVAYGEYVRSRIFEPLAMRCSFADVDEARRSGLARGHRFLFGLTVPGNERQPPAPLVPAGFLSTCALDLGNYLVMMLDEGRFRERQVVSAATLAEMLRPWDGSTSGAGMAWGVGSRWIGHAGSTPTFAARIALLPQERFGIAVLTNVNSGPFVPGIRAVMEGVAGLVAGEPVRPVLPQEIGLKVLLLLLVLGGIARTFSRWRTWTKLGRPRRFAANRRAMLPLAIEAVGTVFVLAVLPRWIGVPLRTILEYFPDLGIAIIASVVFGAVGAVLLSWTRSATTAREATTAPDATL